MEKLRIDRGNRAEARIKRAYLTRSPNTVRNYHSSWTQIQNWLDGETLDDEALAIFLEQKFNEGLSASSIKLFVHSVNFHYKAMRKPSPVGDETKDILEIVRRNAIGRGRGRAHGLTRQEYIRMLSACDTVTLSGLRDKALFRIMWDALLRVSEAQRLKVSDIERTERGDTILRIRQSKTDQYGAGAVIYISTSAAMDLAKWLKFAKITDGYIFRSVKNGVHVSTDKTMTRNAINLVVKKRAKLAGLNMRVTSHSFRRGMAQLLSVKQASTHEIMQAGRWKTPAMVAIYSESVEAERSAVKKYIYDAPIRKGGLRVLEGGKAS